MIYPQGTWLAAYTLAKFEKKVSCELTRREIENYLPLQQVRRQWSDRIKKIDVPLFPNYVFIRADNVRSNKLVGMKGICNFVSFNGKPATVSDADINTIRMLEGENPHCESGLMEGCAVRIIRGPLAGLRGTFFARKGQHRFGIRIETIQQTISLEISAAYLEQI